jgi:hypothetical protein
MCTLIALHAQKPTAQEAVVASGKKAKFWKKERKKGAIYRGPPPPPPASNAFVGTFTPEAKEDGEACMRRVCKAAQEAGLIEEGEESEGEVSTLTYHSY